MSDRTFTIIVVAVLLLAVIFAFADAASQHRCNRAGGYMVFSAVSSDQCVRDGRILPDSVWDR